VRTGLKLAILIAALAATAWSCVFIYWDFKIRRAIQGPDREVLSAAGCRALPYLVTALGPQRRLTFLSDAHRFIVDRATGANDSQFLKAREFEVTDTIDERARKCREIQEWWRAAQPDYHQRWRVWSAKCRS
jgi:hypothetical protein